MLELNPIEVDRLRDTLTRVVSGLRATLADR